MGIEADGERSELDPEDERTEVDPPAGGGDSAPSAGGAELGTGSGKTEVLVSVEGGHIERLGAVAEELRSVGMDVGAVMDDLGVVSGSVEPEKMERLAAVSGVAAVEVGREVHIPPPDSPVQ